MSRCRPTSFFLNWSAAALAAAALAGTAAASGTAEGAQAAAAPRVSLAQYVIPPVQMVDERGRTVRFPDAVNDGRAVVVNFIFTTCASICPLSSKTLSVFQDKLGADRGKVHIVSISIDPEQDTPERLREYAQRFSAGPGWQHYTGTLQASQALQRAFGVYRGDKMGHTPVVLMRPAPDKPWRRIDGFATPEDLLREYRAAFAGG